jgi:iron complex transport system permease protein
MDISFQECARIIGFKLLGKNPPGLARGAVAVVWEIRLPRIICGVLAGMGLASAGVIFQSILQNPLADPYTLGISTGAAFGAAVAIFIGTAYGIPAPVPVFALASALLTLLAVIAVSAKAGGFVEQNLVMSGIIASSFLSAGVSFIKMAAGENALAVVSWLMGSLSAKSWDDAFLLAFVIPLIIAACAFSKELNALALGSRAAQSLGVNAEGMRLLSLVLGAALTALCVSACGVIGFVGLIVPHLLRLKLTSDNRFLLPVSALLGGLLLSAADSVARVLANGSVPVGVLCTLLGGPFFMLVFIRGRKAGM